MFNSFEQTMKSAESQSQVTRALVRWTAGTAIAAFEFQAVLMMLAVIE